MCSSAVLSVGVQRAVLREQSESCVALTSPRNLPVDPQHGATRQLLQGVFLTGSLLFPWIFTVKYVGFKCDGGGIKVL